MTVEVAAEPALARVVNVRDARRGTYTYIGRGSEWGNPFSHRPSKYPDVIRVVTRDEAIERYRAWLWERIKRDGRPLIERLAALHATTLGCHCHPLPCHGDILSRAAAWAARWTEPSPARR